MFSYLVTFLVFRVVDGVRNSNMRLLDAVLHYGRSEPEAYANVLLALRVKADVKQVKGRKAWLGN